MEVVVVLKYRELFHPHLISQLIDILTLMGFREGFKGISSNENIEKTHF